mmetsp:Transcript_12598/g.29238  ORF Transcript_12598/g.29238 Transcript_12598/m.29238 type:complete len:88 (-) Transcript_12598:1581-1844(-)
MLCPRISLLHAVGPYASHFLLRFWSSPLPKRNPQVGKKNSAQQWPWYVIECCESSKYDASVLYMCNQLAILHRDFALSPWLNDHYTS